MKRIIFNFLFVILVTNIVAQTTDKVILISEINNQIKSYGLGSQDEVKVRRALSELVTYLENPNNKLTVDPLSETYTITGVGSERFKGSSTQIKRGLLTGNLKIKNDQDAMSIAIAIYNAAINNLKMTTYYAPSSKESINIGDLDKFVINDIYGTVDNFKYDFGSLRTNEQRKTKLFEFMRQKVIDYLDKAKKYNDEFNYEDEEKCKELLKVLDKGISAWNEVLPYTYRFKWELHKYLLNP